MVQNLAIRETLKYVGVHAAERQLHIIGHQAGDEELALVVSELQPGEVSILAGEGDYTKPSMVTHFISADQFIGALERFGASWGEIGNNADVVLELKSHLSDFLLSILLHAEGDRQVELIKALADNRLGEEVLVTLALKEPGYIDFLASLDTRMAEKGTWQELYCIIQDVDTNLFTTLRKAVLGVSKEEPSSGAFKESPPIKFIKKTLKALAHRAAQHVAPTAKPDQEKAKEVFSEI